MDHLPLLIERCSRKDRAAQKQLYGLLASTMFKTCLRYSSNEQEAEDNLQEGFLKVFENLHQFKSSGSFEGWVRRIMVNNCLQKLRRKTNMHAVVDLDTIQFAETSPHDVISQIGTKDLLKMIQQLPPGYRAVFNLYVFEGMKHKDIAVELGISEGTSKSNLFDARAILQKQVARSMQVATDKGQMI